MGSRLHLLPRLLDRVLSLLKSGVVWGCAINHSLNLSNRKSNFSGVNLATRTNRSSSRRILSSTSLECMACMSAPGSSRRLAVSDFHNESSRSIRFFRISISLTCAAFSYSDLIRALLSNLNNSRRLCSSWSFPSSSMACCRLYSAAFDMSDAILVRIKYDISSMFDPEIKTCTLILVYSYTPKRNV